jgi:hypothetical protein
VGSGVEGVQIGFSGSCGFKVVLEYRGISLKRNRPPPLGPPKDPRYSPTAEAYQGGVSCERGTPVSVRLLFYGLNLNAPPDHVVAPDLHH